MALQTQYTLHMYVFTIEQKVTTVTNAGTDYVYIINNKYCIDFLVKCCRSYIYIYRFGASDTELRVNVNQE